MWRSRIILILFSVVCMCSTLAVGARMVVGSSQPPASSSSEPVVLHVGGVGVKATAFSARQLAELPRTRVSIKQQDDSTLVYEGVRADEVLKAAGMTFGQTLRGERLADYLVVEASDGYRAVYALTELDPDFSDRIVLIADRLDAEPLDARTGPLRIVVSDERRHARWVRNVTRLTIESSPKRQP